MGKKLSGDICYFIYNLNYATLFPKRAFYCGRDKREDLTSEGLGGINSILPNCIYANRCPDSLKAFPVCSRRQLKRIQIAGLAICNYRNYDWETVTTSSNRADLSGMTFPFFNDLGLDSGICECFSITVSRFNKIIVCSNLRENFNDTSWPFWR